MIQNLQELTLLLMQIEEVEAHVSAIKGRLKTILKSETMEMTGTDAAQDDLSVAIHELWDEATTKLVRGFNEP